VAEAGARLAIRLLQDAAERGEIDPWDVDVIGVIDGFLDQLRQRITLPRLTGSGGSFERDLSESSEAFLAASVLVGLKAELLEAATFPPEPILEDGFELEEEGGAELAGIPGLLLPRRPERHLRRRPVAPPPLQRPVTLGELIQQLEAIAERLDQEPPRQRSRSRNRAFSDDAAIAQVSALAHREKLPETTAALSVFLGESPLSVGGHWLGFEDLVLAWASDAERPDAEDLDRDRVGVFWALLFLSAQGRVELQQEGGLYGPLQLRLLGDGVRLPGLALALAQGSDGVPARSGQAA
jgi:segregation and condensation protein A